jgi:hypothetical protein
VNWSFGACTSVVIALEVVVHTSITDRLYLSGAVIITVALLIMLRMPVLMDVSKYVGVLPIFIFALLSLIWSIDRETSLASLVMLACEICIGAWTAVAWNTSAQDHEGDNASHHPTIVAFKMITLVLLVVYCVETVRGSINTNTYWNGFFGSKNELGLFGAFATVVFNAVLSGPKKRLWVVLSFLLIVFSESGTSVLAVLAALTVQTLSRIVSRGRWSMMKIVVLSLACGGIGAIVWHFSKLLLEMLGKDATLTNRTWIWSAAISNWDGNVLVGDGFDATFHNPSKMLDVIRAVGGPNIYTVHNGYLSVSFGLGIVGMTLLIYFVFRLIKLGFYRSEALRGGEFASWQSCLIGTLICYLIENMAEDVALKRGAVFILVSVSCTLVSMIRASGPSKPRRMVSSFERSTPSVLP